MDRRGALDRLVTGTKRLAREERGATIIEFALCSAAFVAMLLGALQIALIYFGQQGIQTSAERMARQIMTGEIRQATMTQEQFRQAACATLPGYMNCNRLYVDVRSGANFATLDTSMPTITRDGSGNINNSWSYATGGTNGVVILRLLYVWKVVGGPFGMTLANQSNGDRLLIGTMVFKSEKY